jgi:hypothetical protein
MLSHQRRVEQQMYDTSMPAGSIVLGAGVPLPLAQGSSGESGNDMVTRLNQHTRNLELALGHEERFRKTLVKQLVANGHDADVLASLNQLDLIKYILEISGGFYKHED